MTKKVSLFFFIAYLLTWSLHFSFEVKEGAFISYLMKFGFTFSGLTMLLLTKDRFGFKQIVNLLINPKGLKFLWIGLLPLIGYFLSAWLSVPMTSLQINNYTSWQEWIYNIGFSSSSGIIFYMFLRGGLGEEIGLRGYVLPLMLEKIKPLQTSLIIGLFWAIWHYPVWLTQGKLIVVVLTLVTLCWSIIFTYVFIKTKSLWVVIFLHAVSNSGDDIVEFVYPNITSFDWELYYILFIVIIGIFLSFSMNKLKLESFQEFSSSSGFGK